MASQTRWHDGEFQPLTEGDEPYVGEHVLILGNDFVSGLWLGACSCGWESREQHPGSDAAEDDWENHCDVVFMEATGG